MIIPCPFHPDEMALIMIWDASFELPNAPAVNHLWGSVMAR